MYSGFYESPIGIIEIKADNDYILELKYVEEKDTSIENNIILECIKQLDEYFIGKRKVFDLKLKLTGTLFQNSVWEKLRDIPYGKTVSYKYIAKAINNEKAVRAVGNANNKNKIPIIIPCHRVVGSNGKLIGYNGGLDKKEWLINHEIKWDME